MFAATGDQTRAAQQFEWVLRGLSDPALEQKTIDLYHATGYPAALRACGSLYDHSYYVGSKVDGARCLMALGDNAGALTVLEDAYRDHEGWMLYVEYDPAFTPLRSNAAFQQLIADVKRAA